MTDRSGWCLKLPVTEYNQAEHDGCYKYFMTRECACTCGHKGAKVREGMNIRPAPETKKRVKKDEVVEE